MRRSLRVLPAVVVALLVLAGIQPAQAATARTISVKPSTTAAVTGTVVTFKGVLTRSPKGSTVKLQHWTGKAWFTAKTTRTTTSTGIYSAALALPSTSGTNYYRTIAPASGTLATATSKNLTIAVLAKVTATLTASATTVQVGSTTTFNGTVHPSTSGTAVTLQRYGPTTWATVATTTVNGSGAFTKTLTISKDGSYRAVVARTGLRAAATSPTVRITTTPVTPAGPVITTSSLPEATTGVAYSATLQAAGSPAGTWGATGLPDQGLSLNTATGQISGTPNGAKTLALHVTFTQTSNGLAATPVDLSLKINPPPPPVILTSKLPDGAMLTAYSAQLYVSGNVAGTWSATGLPSGISVDPSSGLISGTTLLSSDAAVTVGFTQTSNGLAATPKNLTLHIGALGSVTNPTTASAGGQFSCRVDAAKKLWCWGYDDSGELGDGGTLVADPAGVVTPTQVGSATDWTSVSTGAGLVTERHACGIRGTNGYCWGSDKYGELGNVATAGSATSPVAIDGSHSWLQLSAGAQSSCGVTTSGELWCWGDNDFGQLGFDNGSADQDAPGRVGSESDWSQVSVGYTGACAVKGTGALYCLGMNSRGQLGTGNTTSTTAPVAVGTGWAQVSVGAGYTCGVKTDGTGYCWGPSTNGQLGNGKFSNTTLSDELSPKKLGGIDWTSIAAGGGTTCGIKSGGQLWCWGNNAQGQVGDGTNTAKGFGVRIGTDLDWASVWIGDTHSCGVKAGNEIWCWGNNNKGQLGSSTAPNAASNVPVKVTG